MKIECHMISIDRRAKFKPNCRAIHTSSGSTLLSLPASRRIRQSLCTDWLKWWIRIKVGNLIMHSPTVDCFEIAADMRSVEIRPRHVSLHNVMVRENSYICITHEDLAKNFNTAIYAFSVKACTDAKPSQERAYQCVCGIFQVCLGMIRPCPCNGPIM